MNAPHKDHRIDQRDISSDNGKMRRAIGHVRVFTDLQAKDGLSLDAQTAAIEQEVFRRAVLSVA